jgi:putative colanic acid biosynthesis acetyltransferase WcaB
MSYIFQDWNANKANIKGRMILVMFRLGQVVQRNKVSKIIFLPLLVLLKVFLDWFLNVDIPFKTKIGEGCVIYHGHALVIFSDVKIGKNCVLRHSITIGNKGVGDESKSPIIGDNCDIGAQSVIIGDVRVGDNVVVGAGSVVVKDITDNSIVVGNPARIIKKKNQS